MASSEYISREAAEKVLSQPVTMSMCLTLEECKQKNAQRQIDALMQEFDKAQRTMQQHGQEYSCSFMSSSQEISTEWYCVEDMLENAPTIIEAEEEP